MALLFEPFKLGSLEMKNKIIIAPMCQYSADVEAEPTFWHAQQWANYAMSGAGLCIVEATAVSPEGRISDADLGLWNNHQRDHMQKLLQQLSQYSDMPFAIQLAHAGRKASVDKPWLNSAQLSPHTARGWHTVSASELPFRSSDHAPIALDVMEIEDIIDDFVYAAARAIKAGFAAIELHAAHGYLIHQFLSPLSNHRQDDYGGSLENRMRLCLEIFSAMKQHLPKDFPIGVRISAEDWVEGGWDLSSSVVLSQQLEQLGAAYIHVSSGGLDAGQKIDIAANYQVPFAEEIKQHISIPVIAVGLITEAQQAEQILQQDQADAIAIARAILYDPRWPWHAAAELGAQVDAAPQYLRCQPHQYPDLFQH